MPLTEIARPTRLSGLFINSRILESNNFMDLQKGSRLMQRFFSNPHAPCAYEVLYGSGELLLHSRAFSQPMAFQSDDEVSSHGIHLRAEAFSLGRVGLGQRCYRELKLPRVRIL